MKATVLFNRSLILHAHDGCGLAEDAVDKIGAGVIPAAVGAVVDALKPADKATAKVAPEEAKRERK